MYKKPLAFVLALIMVFALVPTMALAKVGDMHKVTTLTSVGKAQLIGGAPQWVFFKQGDPPKNGIAAIWTPKALNDAEKEACYTEAFNFDSAVKVAYGVISFFYGDQIITNGNNNTGEYRVGQENGVWYVYVDKGGLSHFDYKEGESLGKVTVNANVVEDYNIITLQDQYKYDVQNFYKHDVQDFYKYNVQDFYLKDVQDFYGRTAQNIYIPTFVKKAVKAGGDTLVAWRNNKTVPGGTFNNGMTYLEIDAAKARTTEGYTFGIADSSPSNKSVNYNFNVRIDDNVLIISFDKRFISASVSAKVYSTAPTKHDPSGHKMMRTGDVLRLPLPALSTGAKAPANTAQKYYLFFHLENGVNFYETFDYQFADWKLDEIKYSDYEKVDTIEGNPYWVRTETGDPYFVETKTGDRYLDHTDTGDNYRVAQDVEISNIPSTRPYAGAVTLTVDGLPQTLGTPFTLTAGTHTFVLGYAGREVTEIWTVNAGGVHNFTFAEQHLVGEDVTECAANLVEPNQLDDIDNENRLFDVTTENRLEDMTTANQLPDIYNPDTWLDDICRGSTDPEDAESILYGIYTPARP